MYVARWIGRAVAAAAALWLASPASAAWRRAESSNFIVYSQSSEAALRQDVALLEDYNWFLRLLTGIEDPAPANKLRIYMVRGHSALEIVRPGVGENVGGFYTATGAGIAAFVDDKAESGGREGNQILFHEIAHHFMLQYRPTAYPGWYVEGFAEYVSTATFQGDRIDYGLPSTVRASWLANARWLPLEQVLFDRPTQSGEATALYYAQSWLLVHYFLRDPARKAKLVQYLNATREGEAPKAAFARVFGMEPKALQREVEAYARKGMTYSRLKRKSATAVPAMTIVQLPPSADDLMIAQGALEVGVRDEHGPALLARIRSAAARHDDLYSRRILAKAEAMYGDSAAADRLLDPLLAAAPTDPELLYLKGLRHVRSARRGGANEEKERKLAQSFFGRAHKADPNHFQTLMRYPESLQGEQRFLSDNTINVMLLAHELAPQVTEITVKAAQLLLLRERYDEAAALIAPLASSPHEPRLAAQAQAMLAQARARKRLPVVVIPPLRLPDPGKQ